MATIIKSLRADMATVSVVETEQHRLLFSDDVVVGCEHRVDAVRDQACFAAMALMSTVAFLLPRPQHALCLGLGAGTVPSFLRMRGIHTDVVEYDAAVIRLAEQHFLFGIPTAASGGTVIHSDALRFVAQSVRVPERRYDVVLPDLWSGGNEGRALLRPFLEQVRSRVLATNGTLAVNLLAFAEGPHAALAVNVVRTLCSVFDHVTSFVEYDLEEEAAAHASAEATGGGGNAHAMSAPGDEPANLLLLASNSPIRLEPGSEANSASEPGSMAHLFTHFQEWRPPRLQAAGLGLDGRVLETERDWDELAAERRAVAAGMRVQQRRLMPDAGWAMLEDLLHKEEEAPPRKIGRAPPPAVVGERQHEAPPARQPRGGDKEELR